MKKLWVFLLTCGFLLTACGNNQSYHQEDIIVLFTSDVHCAIQDGIGYDGLAAYKKNLEKNNKYVSLVDLGDAIQGGLIGAISKGSYIIDIMNYMGYDFAILGNHEFDYGVDVTETIISEFDGTYLAANVEYVGNRENLLAQTKPYEIVRYGKVDVAYIGISTPYTISSSTPTYFIEDGEYAYDFFSGEDGQRLVDRIQGYVDECLDKGAEYVVALTHMGTGEEFLSYSTNNLIRNTTGIDVVLDGHAHIKLSSEIIENADGEDVLVGSVGTGFDAFGQLTITSNGNITLTYIDNYDKKDEDTSEYIQSIVEQYEEDFNYPLLEIDRTLSMYDSNGIRTVRNRETVLGNLIADAYRIVGQTDVAIINGGAIRSNLNAGTVSYSDIFNIHPFGNTMVTVKVSGQEIIDTLEIAAILVEEEYTNGEYAIGENGSFMHVSGLKYDINVSIPSPVILDEYEDLIGIEGERRVSNVKILVDGTYVDIDPNGEYTLSSIDYIIKSGGCSNNLFLDNELIISEGLYDYQVLSEYLVEVLDGDLSAYTDVEGRINIKKES